MAAIRALIPVGEGKHVEIAVPHEYTDDQLAAAIADGLQLRPGTFRSMQYSRGEYAVFPAVVEGGVDEDLLRDEYEFLRHQFPLVQMINLTNYEGMVRCEGGPVKKLADEGVWPFEQFVQWHKFKIKLSFLHPYKPPTVTWLTDIDHPNIIPKRTGKVCVSLLGKGWLPQTKLAAIVNSLYFLLFDPNPYSHYPNKRCKAAAAVCKKYGFPKKRGGVLSKHENTVTCPNCRRPFIVENWDEKVIQCIHCKVLLRKQQSDYYEEDED